MDGARLDGILEFMRKCIIAKEIPRTGWVNSGIRNPEHVADHMFSTAVLAYLMGRERGLDADRCMKIALVHDVHEVITGDIADRRPKGGMGLEREAKDSARMVELLGDYGDEFRALIDEWVRGETEEARFVREMDTLDYIIQLLRYAKSMKREDVASFLVSPRVDSMRTPEFRYVYEKVRKEIYGDRKE